MRWEKRRREENPDEINKRGRRGLAEGPVWLMSEQRVDAEFHSRTGKEPVYNLILLPTLLPAAPLLPPRRLPLPPLTAMSDHAPPQDGTAVRPAPAVQPRPQSAVARSSVGGLLNNRRPVGSTPIPPSLQAKMAAVSVPSSPSRFHRAGSAGEQR